MKLFQFDRLEEKVLGARFETLPGRVHVLGRRQDDDADLRPALANLPYQPDAAKPGHSQIGDDDRRQAFLEQLQGFLGTVSGLALVVPGAGCATENVLDERLVIHDRHARQQSFASRKHWQTSCEFWANCTEGNVTDGGWQARTARGCGENFPAGWNDR